MAGTTPTILVKKADGSQVRMTMAEFLVYKKTIDQKDKGTKTDDTQIADIRYQIADDVLMSENGDDIVDDAEDELFSSPVEVKAKIDEEIEEDKPVEMIGEINTNLPMVEDTMALSTTTPVKDIFVDEAKYNGIRNTKDTKLRNEPRVVEDKKSETKIGDKRYQIEEDEEIKVHSDYPVLPSKRGDVLDDILPKLSFEVSPELYSRLNSLVISRLKDVRSDEQIAEYAVRAVDKGGLALDEDQAVELVDVISQSVVRDTKYETYEITKNEEKKVESVEDEKLSALGGDENVSEPFPIKPQPSHVAMHDVVMPAVVTPVNVDIDRTTNPINELEQFSLTDFRRLNSKPTEAGKILAEKIKNLHQESYEQFTQGLKAWYNSPLYRQYQNVIQRAIENNQKIDDILAMGGREELTKAEFETLAKGI